MARWTHRVAVWTTVAAFALQPVLEVKTVEVNELMAQIKIDTVRHPPPQICSRRP